MTPTTVVVTNTPAYLPLVLYKGDSYTSPVFTIKIGGVIQNISGDTFKLRIRVKRTETPVVNLALGSGITSPGTGQVYWALTAAQTNELQNTKEYEYDFQWTRSDGTVKTLTGGAIKIVKDITPP
ncbi:MAG: hypothetical protein OHK0019_00200 [Saprospiraceae bacterium]